jgi:Fe-S-cluster-containing dehydrogenase component
MTVTRRDALKVLGAAACAAAVVPADAEARSAKVAGADDVGMLFDSTLCVGCRACQTACKVANSQVPDKAAVQGGVYDAPLDLNGNTKNVIKLAQDGEATTYMKMQCMHCIDPACVSVCMLGSLHKIANGTVAYDPSICVGCRYCQVGCPFNVPKFEWAKALPIIDDPKIVKCEMCRHRKEGPACCEVCPRGAVIYGKHADLLAEARRRVAQNKGKYFEDRIYGEKDGGGTHVLTLSPAKVSFTALGLPKLDTKGMPDASETIQHGIYQGFITPVIAYGVLAFFTWKNRGPHEEGKEEGK